MAWLHAQMSMERAQLYHLLLSRTDFPPTSRINRSLSLLVLATSRSVLSSGFWPAHAHVCGTYVGVCRLCYFLGTSRQMIVEKIGVGRGRGARMKRGIHLLSSARLKPDGTEPPV